VSANSEAGAAWVTAETQVDRRARAGGSSRRRVFPLDTAAGFGDQLNNIGQSAPHSVITFGPPRKLWQTKVLLSFGKQL
jgi:hypothetical protein